MEQLTSCLHELATKTSKRFGIGSWASAHRGKWGQLTPWKKMDDSKNIQKEQFSEYFESNQGTALC